MKQKKIFLNGMGLMGREILKLASAEPARWTVTGYSAQAKKSDVAMRFISPDQEASEVDAEVVIDFSNPGAIQRIQRLARHNKFGIVSGTTGLSKTDFEILRDTATYVPVLWAPNMSVGVTVLKHALHSLRALPAFDFQIEEFHHNKKRDNPSGTALSLHAEMESILGRDIAAPVGIRGGGIFGVHSVFAMGPDEVLEFKHTALNRSIFAKGALLAAEWVATQAPGLYTMDDVLNLKGTV